MTSVQDRINQVKNRAKHVTKKAALVLTIAASSVFGAKAAPSPNTENNFNTKNLTETLDEVTIKGQNLQELKQDYEASRLIADVLGQYREGVTYGNDLIVPPQQKEDANEVLNTLMRINRMSEFIKTSDGFEKITNEVQNNNHLNDALKNSFTNIAENINKGMDLSTAVETNRQDSTQKRNDAIKQANHGTTYVASAHEFSK